MERQILGHSHLGLCRRHGTIMGRRNMAQLINGFHHHNNSGAIDQKNCQNYQKSEIGSRWPEKPLKLF